MDFDSSNIEEILALGLPLIKQFEGFRTKPYLCSAGVPTIGYGSTYYETGLAVSLKDPEITKEYAETLLQNTVLKTYLPAVLRYCPTLYKTTQVAAILSWTYNLGTGNLYSSTMRKKILAKDWNGAVQELLKWNRARGVVSPGLDRRRHLEAAIFVK